MNTKIFDPVTILMKDDFERLYSWGEGVCYIFLKMMRCVVDEIMMIPSLL